MRRVVLGELLHRRGRTLALLLGILVTTTSFAVLTGTSESQRLDVRGTVQRSFRGDYDILVRPHGARDALERRTQQLRPNFLSDTFGGISVGQWRRIERIPGVEVAAPLENIGYLLPTIWIPIRLSPATWRGGPALLRAKMTWRSQGGLTHAPDPGAEYAYVTPDRLGWEPRNQPGSEFRKSALREYVPGRKRPLAVCTGLWDGNDAPSVIDGPFTAIFRSKYGCWSTGSHNGRWGGNFLTRRRPNVLIPWVFPLLLTAVDPRAEARLTGLDHAVTSGRYLRGADRTHLGRPYLRFGERAKIRQIPVLVASRTYEHETDELAIERLGPASLARWRRPFPFGVLDNNFFSPIRFLIRQPAGPVVQRTRLTAATAYRQLRRAIADPNEFRGVASQALWRTAPIRFRPRGDALAPVEQSQALDSWRDGSIGAGLDWSYVSPAAQDVGFREVRSHPAHEVGDTPERKVDPLLQGVGTFDPDRMGGAPEPGAPALRTIQPSLLTPRDAAARRRLHGRPLRANGHLGGYLAQPPALITTLRAARAFGGDLYPEFHPKRAISAVRVRVAGVTGIDALSRERIRQAAADRHRHGPRRRHHGRRLRRADCDRPARRALRAPGARAVGDVGAQGRRDAGAQRDRPQEPRALRADPRRLRPVRRQRGQRGGPRAPHGTRRAQLARLDHRAAVRGSCCSRSAPSGWRRGSSAGCSRCRSPRSSASASR